jgi:patatin-related protein
MTGGTSLAVWIGGVTAELYDVVNRESGAPDAAVDDEDVYGRLLALTQTDALVDIIAGTSAGGLNGIMLSVAWSTHAPTKTVTDLRDTWMRLGSIDALLRKPSERNPPSLLYGDDYFWPELEKVLQNLAAASATGSGAAKRKVSLLTTVTSLVGEPTLQHDDFGQALHETRHAQTLSFTQDDIAASDTEWASRMALAARSSASIPAVFEASFLPIGESVDQRPTFDDQATFKRSRWVMDGGVLDNKPIGIALDEIFRRNASGDLRRVILYVNPTPGGPVVAPADDFDEIPTIRNVLSAANRAPKNEEIRADLARLREANRVAERAVDVRVALGDLVRQTALDVVESANAVLKPFRGIRTRISVREHLDRAAAYEVRTVNQRMALERALTEAAGAWLRVDTALPRSIAGSGRWPWGIAPLEYVAAMLFDLVTSALRLPVPALEQEDRERLGRYRADVGHLVDELADVRSESEEYWRGRFEAVPDPDQLSAWATESYRGWPETLRRRLGRVADALAAIALEMLALLRASPLPDEAADVPSLRSQIALFAPALPDPLPSDPEARDLVVAAAVPGMLAQLVGVHILAITMGDTAQRPQRIEFLEVSFRAANALDPDRRPEDKLAGEEFNRLGAFVKASWRANDWMWGRLDGAYQLVLLLLDPGRLLQLGKTPDDIVDALDLRDPRLPQVERAVREELAFLDHAAPPPRSLPICAGILAGRVQTRIVREELPNVYLSVLRSKEAGGGEGDDGGFRFAYEQAERADPPDEWDDATCRSLLRACRLGSESQAGEVGRDALTRSGGQAVAVAGNALTGEHSGIGLPGRFAAPLRQLALVAYALTRLSTTRSQTAFALSAIVFGTAGAIIAIDLLGASVNTGFVVLAWMTLIVGCLLAILRSGVWSLVPALLAVLVVALALIGTDLRQAITTTPGKDLHATIRKGDTLDVRGSIVFAPNARGARTGDDQDEVRIGRGRQGAVERGRVEVRRRTEDLSWKRTYVLRPVSVASVLITLALLLWIAALVRQRKAARTRAERERRIALETGRTPPSTITVPRLLPAVVVSLALVIGQHWLFRWIFTGSDTGVRRWVADAADSLAKHDVVVVVIALVFVGVFVGLAWDRGVRPAVPALERWRERFDTWGPRGRWGLVILVGVIGVTLLVLLGFLSDRLEQDGASYNVFQTAGSGIGDKITAWPDDIRGTAAFAAGVDIVFALSYGFVGLLCFGSWADKARKRAKDRAEARAGLLTLAAWSVVLAALADVLENVGLLIALGLFGIDARTAGIGVAVLVAGGVKWFFTGLTGVAALFAVLTMLPGHKEEPVGVETAA